MECCAHCQESGNFFDENVAEKELRSYRKEGISKKSGRLLVDGLKTLDIEGTSVLDIGGGIGAIPLELMAAGADESTLVEASPNYLQTAKGEAHRRGYGDRMTFQFGDFVELAPELPDHDIVTLDRVICCYPHMEKLVEASTDKAGRWYGVVYPKANVFSKFIERIGHLYCAVIQSDFRPYVHDDVDQTIQQQGFTPFYDDSTILWRVTLYERDSFTASG